MREVMRLENVGKLYRLGEVGTGTLSQDLNRWWARARGKEDPFSKVGLVNDRTRSGKGNDIVWALKDISMSIREGEVIGVIGRNGAGKSTALKIISRITTPSYGTIKIRGRVASLLEVGTGFHPEMTGRENIFMNGTLLGMTRREIQRKMDDIVDFAGVSLYVDTPVKRYSSGMQVRLGFAVAAFLEPEILVVDEVLAVGDAEFQAKATGKMEEVSRQQGRTVLFVSHNMGSVSKLCTRCITLKNGQLDFEGNTQEAIARYSGDMTVDSSIAFNHPIVKNLTVVVRDGALLLELKYESSGERPLSVGYVVADQLGNKLFGANPKHLSQSLPVSAPAKGTVKTQISMPKLREGIYRISLWVGDGYTDFFEAIDCLAVHIDDMVPLEIRSSSAVVGPVIPETKWFYEP